MSNNLNLTINLDQTCFIHPTFELKRVDHPYKQGTTNYPNTNLIINIHREIVYI